MQRAQPLATRRRIVCSRGGRVRTFTIERNDRVYWLVELIYARKIRIQQFPAGETLGTKLVLQLTRRCCGEGLGNHGRYHIAPTAHATTSEIQIGRASWRER